VTAKSVPAGDDWLHEPKLDGNRLQVAKHGRTVRHYS
jgi:ATP-dependent DNA ligase